MVFDEGEESLQSKMEEGSYFKVQFQDHQTLESNINLELEGNKLYSHHDIAGNEAYDRNNSSKRNLQSQALTIDQIHKSLTEIDKISKSYQDEAQKLVKISRNSESKSPDRLFELDTKKVSLTTTNKFETSFSSTKKSQLDSSREEIIVSQNRKFRKKCETKHYIESETEPENLDDVIAGLKEVAEKDDSELIEKARRNSQCKDDSKFGRDRLSLFKPSKRDDDDLESLTSVDTDMAPLSETSRDLECTYSDLESISESISSKGDPLLVTNKSQVSSTLAPIETFPITMEQFNPELLFELYSKEEKSIVKSSPGNSKVNSNIETLPVEKLQAMIAELDDVLSSDSESADDSDMIVSEHKSIKNISRENSASNEETLFNSDLKTSQKSLSQVSFHSDKSKTTKTSTFDDTSDPIEVKFQAVHVGGDIEFAKANSSIQEGYEESLRMTQKALVTTPEIEESSVVENLQCNLPHQQDKENDQTRKVSVQSSETPQLTHVITMQLPQTQFLASAEQAVLVTVESSYPGSEESLVNDSKGLSNTVIESYNPQTAKAIIEYEISDFKNDQWIKTVEDRVLEIYPEVSKDLG